MRQLGTKKHSRLMAVCFFIGALAIGGMPPLSGFWSKFAIYVAAGQAHLWWTLGYLPFYQSIDARGHGSGRRHDFSSAQSARRFPRFCDGGF